MKRKLSILMVVFLTLTLVLPTTALAAPLAPSGLAAVVSGPGQVDLFWSDNSVDETGFSIERSDDGGVTYAEIGTSEVNVAAFSDTTVVTGATYYYRVIASDPIGGSPSSNVVSTTVSAPAAPSDLSVHVMQSNWIDLVWTDQSNNEWSFRIERSLDGFTTAPSGSFPVAPDQRTFSDVSISAGNTYSYRVVAVNGIGASMPSNTASATLTEALRVGPIDPASIYPDTPPGVASGLPGYYQDDTGARLALLPITGNGLAAPTQIFDDPTSNPYSVFLGFGTEAFYYYAENVFTMPNGGKVVTVFGLEEAFGGAGNAVPGQEFVFARTRVRIDIPVAGVYRVYHPYDGGTPLVFNVETPGTRAINYTSDIGIPRDFSAAANANITRFLRQTVPPPPPGWIGDGASVGPVTGSPNGFNKVRIEGPLGSNLGGPGIDFVESTQFMVSGRLLPAVTPIADFGVSLDPISGAAPNTATFSDTSTGSPTAWSWDFGDGNTSTVQNPVHIFDTAGIYTVRLTVTNAAATTSTSQTVEVYSAPVASFTHSPPNGLPPVAINFTDTSTGTPANWLWDFGDGTTSTLQNPGHTYATAGTYIINLTITNPAGSDTTSQTISISSSLIASFDKGLIPTDGVAPVTATFTDTSTGTITGWLWDFGDGTTSIDQNPVNTYAAPGNYTVMLTVTDAEGSAGTSQVVNVYSPPVASFNQSPAFGPVPLTVSFIDTSTGNPTSWLWDFGDGTTSIDQNPTRTYTAFGRYTVTLTVTNPAGTASTSQLLTVSTVDPTTLKLQVGPIDPNSVYLGNLNSGLPSYYEDDLGTRVSLLPLGTSQIFDPPVTGNAYSQFLGFGTEAFYWVAATASDTAAGKMTTIFGIESAFGGAGDAVPGQEFVFVRTRLVADVPVAGTYTWDHPYGTETIVVTADDVATGGIFYTSDIGVQRDFLAAGAANVSRFLRPTTPAPPGWLGTGVVGTVTGSPTEFNRVRLTGPEGSNLGGVGIDFVETDQFKVNARLFTLLSPGFTWTLDPATGVAPATATFTDTTTGATPTGWSWDFGDGATSIDQNPVHTYAAPGNYTVTLTVTDATGAASTSQIVSVFDTLVAGFTFVSGLTPMSFTFTDTSTGVPASWLWDFGDGATDTVQNPVHTYAVPGTHNVTLTVTNPTGSASVTQSVVASSTPPESPVPTAPADGATVASITPVLAWNAAAGAVTYEVMVSPAIDRTFAQPIIHGTGITALDFQIPAQALSASAVYWWQVRASNANGDSAWSTALRFRTPAGPLPPRPIAPRGIIGDLTPTITWTDIAGGVYDVQVSSSRLFSSIAAEGVGLATPSFTVTAGALQGSTIYYWRVRVTTEAGTSRWLLASFRTPLGPRRPPIPLLPRGTVTTLTPTLEWRASAEALSYDVQLSTSSRFTDLLLDQTGITAITLDVPITLAPGIRYFWRARAVNAYGVSVWRIGAFITSP